MTVVVIILSSIIVLLLFIIRNLYLQSNQYEKIVMKQVKYLIGLNDLLKASEKRLREIDKSGAFEADDEVGIFFQELKDIYDNIDQVLLNEKYGTQKDK